MAASLENEQSKRAQLQRAKNNTPTGSATTNANGTAPKSAPRVNQSLSNKAANLALNKNRKNLTRVEKTRGRAGQVAGAALGSYIAPGIGTAILGWLGRILGESKVGEWAMWLLIIAALLWFLFIFTIIAGLVVAACDASSGWGGYFASSVLPYVAGLRTFCSTLYP